VNLRETAEILGYLSAAFPKNEMFEETVTVWSDQLVNVDFEVAQKTAKNVVAADQWFPTVARFLEVLAVETRFTHSVGCDKCDLGFSVLEDGSVQFCNFCRPARPVKVSSRRKELAYNASDWKAGLQAVREKLEAS